MAKELALFSSLPMGSVGDQVPAFGDLDPMGVFKFYSTVYQQFGVLRQGFVVAYHPQTHSAAVQIHGEQSIWTCTFADEPLSYAFGFSLTHPAREGELVAVIEVAKGGQAGIIIGRIPFSLCFSGKGDLYNDPDQYHRQAFTQLLNPTKDRAIPCFVAPFEKKEDDSTHIATHFRPTDVYPGEFAHLNQHNCGMRGGLFSATLCGGGANLRMSALTNGARLSCANYARHSLLGSMSEFHNGRYVSSERNVAMYQEERLGGDSKEAQVWTDDSEQPVGRGMGLKGEQQTMRPRLKELAGYFGHLMAQFCLRPDPDDPGIRVQGESSPKEEGVSRETIDPSGQYRLSAAGMIAIERTGRIPVPVRTAYPSEKDHDLKKDPEKLEPFEHNDSDPAYRQLELFDRQAYDLKNQYARVDGLGNDKPDYYVPQEEDLKPLKDKYDEKFTKSETVKLEKYDKRRAGAYIGEDGSIIIRDAWGSEIVMLGGNVTIACAGNVMLLPGKSQLTIAGDDIVQKAQNSVDIHASEHDVRLSAAHNMEILGGGDESAYSGGVIIESRGKEPSPWDGKDKGEGARLSGITLKTKNQAVVVDGQQVVVRSRKDTRILSGDKGKIDGKIALGAKMIRARAKSTYISSGRANVVLADQQANVVAKTINILSESDLTLNKGSKTPIPLKWEDVGNTAAEVNPQYNEATQDLEKDKEASIGFDTEALEKMIFGFRDSQECGTDRSWTLGASGGKFRLYEPAWVQVMKIYETLRNGGVDAKVYEEKPEWENGRPFPGKEAEDDGEYVQLSGLQPKNLTTDGFNVSRKNVKEKSEVEPVALKSGYRIRK